MDLGHNGCDTRNDILRRKLSETTYREGTSDCVVVAGTLTDPYTGARIDFAKAEAYKVGIDHIYPPSHAPGTSAPASGQRRGVAAERGNPKLLGPRSGPHRAEHGSVQVGEHGVVSIDLAAVVPA